MGAGTTFFLDATFALDSATADHEAPVEPAIREHPVLVIEDNDTSRQVSDPAEFRAPTRSAAMRARRTSGGLRL